MMALARKAREGGSWHVRVSLAQTAHWLTRLGRLPNGFACPDPKHADVADLLDEMDTPQGRLTFVKHAAVLSETPALLGPAAGAARHARAGLAAVGGAGSGPPRNSWKRCRHDLRPRIASGHQRVLGRPPDARLSRRRPAPRATWPPPQGANLTTRYRRSRFFTSFVC